MDKQIYTKDDSESSENEDIEDHDVSTEKPKGLNDLGFTIDTIGSSNADQIPLSASTENIQSSIGDRTRLLEELFPDTPILTNSLKSKKPVNKIKNLVKEVLADLGFNDNGTLKKKPTKRKTKLPKEFEKREIKKILEKSVITSDFEKLHVVPPFEVSEKNLREQRKKDRALTKGTKWYGLPATEMTDEVKRDLQVLQMRSVLDPKHFYKKNDLKVLPKYFQIGKVMDSPLDFYNNRLPKKQRKKTLVDELLADAEFNKYNKRKYKEIIQDRQKTHYKAWRQAKRLKKKK